MSLKYLQLFSMMNDSRGRGQEYDDWLFYGDGSKCGEGWGNKKCGDQYVFLSRFSLLFLVQHATLWLSHLRLISQLFTSVNSLLRLPHAITFM